LSVSEKIISYALVELASKWFFRGLSR